MNRLLSLTFFLTLSPHFAMAHEGHSHAPSPQAQKKIIRVNTEPPKVHFVVQRRAAEPERPELAKLFGPFAEKVKVRFDRDFLHVESNGMPDHPMMIGITAWQQQVPLPQPYAGSNAWRIPLHPVPAKSPLSAKSNFFRGAIALAANGVPIFNPIKNDGKTDTFLAGELDQWGGHCGRADDYHYHIAPVHLEKVVGAGKPIALALDGYPIYGYDDPNGKPPTDLDWLNGHKGPDGAYHYHATKTYPYLNGGFYGEVLERGGQVDPQPRAQGVRPALRGLRGAKITGFGNPKPDNYVVVYDVSGEKRSVRYEVNEDGSATFTFVSLQGTTTENYRPRRRGGDGDDRRRDAQPPPRRNQPQGDPSAMDNRGGPPRRSEDPVVRALDTNSDGEIDKAELQRAPVSLRTLDKNKDGSITREELAASGKRFNPSNRGGGTRGPQSSDGPRQPWILVHKDEIDLDKNNIISRQEIVGEATKAFFGFDANSDGKLTASELSARGGSRSAMAGFLKGHSREIDRDDDGTLTQAEVVGNAERMFNKMDRDNNGEISPEELETSRRR